MGNSTSNSARNSLYLDIPDKPRKARSRGGSRSSVNSLEPPSPPPYSASAPTSRSVSRVRLSPRASPTHSRSSSRASIYSYTRKLDRDYLRTPLRKESIDDALQLLEGYDTVIIIDDSLSMSGHSWEEAREAMSFLAKMAGKYDSNGIDIHFLNSAVSGEKIKHMDQVRRLFDGVQPRGATPTGRRLEQLLQRYISNLEKADDEGKRDIIKPVNYIMITDGEPSDDPESVIVANARRLDARNFPLCQVGIQFVQIGNSKKAAKHLRELDDNLSHKYEIRDIVDTVPYIGKIEGDLLVKVMVGAINRKHDKESAGFR